MMFNAFAPVFQKEICTIISKCKKKTTSAATTNFNDWGSQTEFHSVRQFIAFDHV